jgi:hypothetical protein
MRTELFWGYYAASSDNNLTSFRGNLSVPASWVKEPTKKAAHTTAPINLVLGFLLGSSTPEVVTDRLSQNVGKELSLLAA